MQRFGAILGSGVLAGLCAASANAAVLYNSGGFEATAGFTSVGQNNIIGQTGGTPASTFAGTTSVPTAKVGTYFGGTNGNLQFVALDATGSNGNGTAGNDSGFFYPTTYSNTPYQAAGQSIAIIYTMTTSNPTATSGSPFFGITAFDDGGNVIARLGVNNSAGANSGRLVGSPAEGMFSGFTATPGTFYQYELLLNYAAQTYSVYTAPADGSTAFTLRGTGAFATASTTFADADLTTFSLDGAAYSGTAVFDNYSVQTVPEPATLAAAGLAFGLLGRRRGR